MIIDYVALLLINMAAGFLLLAAFLFKGFDSEDRAKWAPAFLAVGLVAFINGLHMIWNWPLPGPYNSAFGEMSVLLGALFLGAAWATGKNLSMGPLGLYALLPGLAAIDVGLRIINLHLTKAPGLSGIGFILSGLGGVLAAGAFCSRSNRGLRYLMGLVLLAAAFIWAFTGLMAYWGHLESFGKWAPATMK